MFDAGAIESRMTVRLDQFNRDMTKAEERVKRFTDTPRRVKIVAVFDASSISKARQIFAQLDNQLSRDAASRLRSSPQGSILGTLNALLSPHPIIGSPSTAQSGQLGALGRIVNAPSTTIRPKAQTRNDTFVDNVIGVDDTVVRQKASQAGKTAADAAADAADKETAKRSFSLVDRLLGRSGGGNSEVDRVTRFLRGAAVGGVFGGRPGAIAGGLLGGIGPGILGLSAKTAGVVGIGGSLLGALPALAGGLAPLGVGAAGLGVLALGAKQLIGQKNTPGQAPTQGPLFDQAQAAGDALKKALAGATSGLVGPLSGLFKQIPSLAKQVTPVLAQVFGSTAALIQPAVTGLVSIVKQVGPGLAQAFKAAAPSLAPLLAGLGALAGNIMPGLVSLLKAAKPAVDALASVFATLGRDLGTTLAAFAPVLASSSVIFKAIADVLGALLPIVGKLAAIFATSLAPVFVQFAAVVKTLLPFLVIIGKVISSLAGAVLADLVSAFGALAQLLKAIAPSLTVFANAISQVFTVLENTGTFAILGDALEAIVGPLAKVINALLRGLTPILGPLIKFIGDLSALIVTELSGALTALLPVLTKLVVDGLGLLLKIITPLLPVITQLVGVFGAEFLQVIVQLAPPLLQIADVLLKLLAQAVLPLIPVISTLALGFAALVKFLSPALVLVVTDLATALTAIITAIPPGVLTGIALAIGAIVSAIKIWTIVQAIINAELFANPIGLIILAVAALAVGIVELVKHWSTVWGFIKRIAEDAWNFIYNGFGKFLLPLLGPVGLLVLGIIEVWQHWKQILGFLVHFVIGDFVQPVTNAFLSLIGFMIHGVADAFGWIPGLGGKLHDAARAFDTFKDQVNQSLANIVKSVDINLSTSGSGSIKIVGTGLATRTINTSTGQVNAIGGHTIRDGALITRGQGPRVDDQPAMLAKGELVVPAHLVAAGMANNMRGLIPGFSAGALIGGRMNSAGRAIDSAEAQFGSAAVLAFAQAAVKAAQAAQAAAVGGGVSVAGLSGGSGFQAFQQVAARLGWGGALFQDWVNLEMREAGFSLTATNPSSGAYGMAQFIQGPSEYYTYGGNPNTYIGQAVAMANYIIQRYGNPAAAWAHEVAFNWYNMGGLVGKTKNTRPPRAPHQFAMGGRITEPIFGIGASGQTYTFGENARFGQYETVTPDGSGGMAKIADTVIIQLPEGTSVAAAMTELSFRVHTARMQGFIGAGSRA